MFDLQLERVVSWINENGYATVALQFPEGLKSKASAVADAISANTSASPLISGDPCYGACDIKKDYAEALVHFGHSSIPSMDDGGNVLYIEARAVLDIGDFPVPEELPHNIGILATIQYVDLIPEVKSVLESHGRNITVPKGNERIMYPGQVLGCNCSPAVSIKEEVDAFLFIGEGDFHPLAAAFGTDKKVFALNPFTKEIRNMDEVRDRILRKRFAAIQSAKDARSFMIIVCTKAGQRRDAAAKDAGRKIRDAGRKAYTAVMEEISPERLIHYDVDAFVNTACPRIAMDDSARYGKPMLTPSELDIVLGLKEWEEYEFDQI